jgi:hypothetical protein
MATANKLSLREHVVKIVQDSGPVKSGYIIRATKRDAGQVYTTVSQLVKAGVLARVDGHITMPLTKKSEAPRVVKTALFEEAVSNHRSEAAQSEIAKLKDELDDVKVRYFDALAVIRYLELKLANDTYN